MTEYRIEWKDGEPVGVRIHGVAIPMESTVCGGKFPGDWVIALLRRAYLDGQAATTPSENDAIHLAFERGVAQGRAAREGEIRRDLLRVIDRRSKIERRGE
jgi:hypothetical protein